MRAYLVAGLVTLSPIVAHAQVEQQQTVDRAALAVEDLVNDRNGTDAQSVLRQARAVIICPQVLRAGFLFGGQGGTCVLMARDAAGSWSSPAFYELGGASFGFQAGMQDAEVMFFVMSDRGLRAVLDTQFKFGADAAATFVDAGGGVEGATSAAMTADIVGFSRARGLYAGITLGGSILAAKSDWNQIYYRQPVAPQQVVISMQVSNPGADPLRAILSRYGTQVAQQAPIPLQPGPGYGAPPPQYPMGQQQYPGAQYPPAPQSAPVRQQPLPPARRY